MKVGPVTDVRADVMPLILQSLELGVCIGNCLSLIKMKKLEHG